MIAKLFFYFPVRRNLFLQILIPFRSNFSVLAESNVSSCNAPSQNLFLHFVTTTLNMSSADAAKMLKSNPSLGRLKALDSVEQFACMLNRHGCTEDQIANVIRYHPKLLTTGAERVLEPKIQVLKDSGVEVVEFITRFPRVLSTKLENLCSNLELLKTVFPTHGIMIRAIMRNPHILRKNLQNVLKPSIAFWEDIGFRGTELTKFLLLNPWALTRSSLTPEQLDLIRRIGIHKERKMYKYVVSIVATSRIEVLESKIDNLQLCGLPPEEVWELVRVYPLVLNYSEENIKKKMEFMLNYMGLSVKFVTKHPNMFTIAVDKVTRPRFLVLQTMTAMNGAEEVNTTRLYRTMIMTEAKLVAEIIDGHPQSATLRTVYKNAIANVSKSSKIKSF